MIRGVLLPIITPFDEKVRVDEQMMRQLVDFHIKAGVQGLFVLGSTGQGPAMTIDERKQAAAIALDQAKSRVPVVIHVGTADAGSTVELAEHAAAHRADAMAIVPPYYYSDHTEYEIMAHYKAVHKAVPLPIYIYENPKYSGISVPPGLAALNCSTRSTAKIIRGRWKRRNASTPRRVSSRRACASMAGCRCRKCIACAASQ